MLFQMTFGGLFFSERAYQIIIRGMFAFQNELDFM